MARDRARDTKRTVGSHAEIMGALGRATKAEPAGTTSLFPNMNSRLTPETHVNVVSEPYHKKWTSQSDGDYDAKALDEKRG